MEFDNERHCIKPDEREIGIARDHEGFELKNYLSVFLKEKRYEIKDFGDFVLNNSDEFPDFVISLSMGGRITGFSLACELVQQFINARFKNEE